MYIYILESILFYVDLQCFYNFIYVVAHHYCGLLQLPATEIGPNTYMGLHNFNWLAQLIKEKYKTAAANNKNKNENLLKEKKKMERTVREKKFKIVFNLIYFFITSALSPSRSLSVFLSQIPSSSLFLSLSVSISQIYFFII